MANRSVKVTLSANVTDFKAQLRSAASSLDELAAKADRTGQAATTGLGRMTQSMQLQRDQWDQTGAALTAFGAVTTTALAGSAKAAIDWESAFAGVKKTAGEGWNLDKLNQDLRALASELPASHAEIAAVAEAAGQLGIHEENIASFTKAMINMGEATNLSADEAATTLARFANIMGTSQSEFENLGSSIVALGNSYATTEAEIADMAMRLASAGNQIGLTEGDVLGIATALSSVGIEAEAGGTAFSKVMLDMRKAVDTGSEKLAVFAEVAGMTSEAFGELFRENSGEALTRFIQGLGEMEKAGQSTQPILEELGMTDIRVGNALRSSASAADLFAEAMQTGNQAYSENTALSAEANARYETLASQMGILRNKVVEAAIGFGEQLMPAIELGVKAISGIVDTISGLPGPVQAVLAGMSGLAGVAALAGGSFLLLGPRVMDAVVAFQALKAANIPVLSKSLTLLGAAMSAPFTTLKGTLHGLTSLFKHPIQAVKNLAGAISGLFSGAVSAAGNLGGLTGALGKVKSAASGAGTAFKSLSALTKLGIFAGLATGAGAAAKAIFGMNNEMIATERLLERFNQWDPGSIYDKLFAGFDEGAKENYQDLNRLFEEMAHTSVANKLTPDFLDSTGFDDMRKQILELDSQLASLSTAEAVDGFQKLFAATDGSREVFDDMLSALPGLREALYAAAEGAGFAADETGAWEYIMSGAADKAEETGVAADGAADGIENVKDAASETVSEMQALIDVMSEYGQLNMSADEAAINYSQTLREVNGLLEDEAFKTASATEQAEMKRSALIDLADAGWREVEAMQDQGVESSVLSEKQNQLARDFVATAQQMGFTADEAVDLAKKYGLVPDSVKTAAEFQDYQARAQAQGYLAYLQGMDGKTVNTYMYNHLIEIRETRYKGNSLAQGAMTVAANRYAVGGPVYGPGTWTSDSIPAWLSNGEYVIRASSVAKYGRDLFDKLNAGRFANGGYVDAGRVRAQMPVSSSERGVTVNQYVQHALVEPDSKLQSDAAATARTLAGIY